ncbi:DNA repair protein rad52 [Kappamyces sp. JEL0829]|nr:DNA repair protein rad52 [Kappamyces sp. JEL0829]
MFGTSPFPQDKEQEIKELLSKKLGPEFLAERAGPGGKKVPYLEGWRCIELANDILGFNGWSNSIVNQTVDFIDHSDGKYSVGVATTVRITLQDGSYREDVGYGLSENLRSKGDALEKARKSSVTDAIKRALKHLGNTMGNCLNSKEYMSKVKKVGMPSILPLDPSQLHRHRDYRIKIPAVPGHAAPVAGPAFPQPELTKSMSEPIPLVAPVQQPLVSAPRADHDEYMDDDGNCFPLTPDADFAELNLEEFPEFETTKKGSNVEYPRPQTTMPQTPALPSAAQPAQPGIAKTMSSDSFLKASAFTGFVPNKQFVAHHSHQTSAISPQPRPRFAPGPAAAPNGVSQARPANQMGSAPFHRHVPTGQPETNHNPAGMSGPSSK